ncbi:MAG: hypothetical protein JO287_08420, partial [Pseudonocardiales bacterium]|nr:hypothetical protein [Pseudonocardiales bacterium]
MRFIPEGSAAKLEHDARALLQRVQGHRRAAQGWPLRFVLRDAGQLLEEALVIFDQIALLVPEDDRAQRIRLKSSVLIQQAIQQLQLPAGLVETYQLIRGRPEPPTVTEIAEQLQEIATQHKTTVPTLRRRLVKYSLGRLVDAPRRTTVGPELFRLLTFRPPTSRPQARSWSEDEYLAVAVIADQAVGGINHAKYNRWRRSLLESYPGIPSPWALIAHLAGAPGPQQQTETGDEEAATGWAKVRQRINIGYRERVALYQRAVEAARLRQAREAAAEQQRRIGLAISQARKRTRTARQGADTPSSMPQGPRAAEPLTAAGLWRLHDAQLFTIDELAEMTETTVPAVRKEIEKHGIPRRLEEEKRLVRLVKRAIKLAIRKGMSSEAIAELLNFDVDTVRMILDTRTVPTERANEATQAWRLHHDQWFSLREVAEIMSLDLPTVWKYVKSHGTPRKWKEAENVQANASALLALVRARRRATHDWPLRFVLRDAGQLLEEALAISDQIALLARENDQAQRARVNARALIQQVIHELQLAAGLVDAYQLIRGRPEPPTVTEIAEQLREIATERNTTVTTLRRGLFEYDLGLLIESPDPDLLRLLASRPPRSRTGAGSLSEDEYLAIAVMADRALGDMTYTEYDHWYKTLRGSYPGLPSRRTLIVNLAGVPGD